MLLALAAELLGVPVPWTAVVPVALLAVFVARRVLRTRRVVRPVPALAEPDLIPRDELAWLALGVPTQPFFDHERTTA